MITVVSGQPRSGTSLTMQMLAAAGYPIYWNRQPNFGPANPRGYYEIENESFNDMPAAEVWQKCEDQFVKVFPHNWMHICQPYEFRIIYLDREPNRVALSQVQMMKLEEQKKIDTFEELEPITRSWREHCLEQLKGYHHIVLQFDDLFTGAAQEQLGAWLGANPEQIQRMKDCVVPSLRHF